MKFILEYNQFLNEEEEERFSGRHIPDKYKASNNRKESRERKPLSHGKSSKTVRGKASKEEFDKVLDKAKSKTAPGDSVEYSIMAYAKQVRPFKELVTNSRLMQKFDSMKLDAVRKRMLYQLDAVVMDEAIRLYIENQIVAADNPLALANLVMKYSYDLNAKKEAGGDFNFFTKFNISYNFHDRNSLRALDKIRRSR